MSICNHHQIISESETRTAFVDGHYEEICHFDFDEIDRLAGVVETSDADTTRKAAELLSVILSYCWSGQPLRSAVLKFCAVSAGLRPDLVGQTYEQLAARLGVTKQALSKAALRFQDSVGMKFQRSRPLTARAKMSHCQMGHPNTHIKKPVISKSSLP